MRDLVGMRTRSDEDVLRQLLSYHGLCSKDASDDFESGWGTPPSSRGGTRTLGWEATESGRQAPTEGQSASAEELCGSVAGSVSEADSSGEQKREPLLRKLE